MATTFTGSFSVTIFNAHADEEVPDTGTGVADGTAQLYGAEAGAAGSAVSSNEVSNALDGHLKTKKTEQVREAYNSDTGKEFYNLPPNAQTAIMSVYWQHGTSNPQTAAPKFWGHVTQGNWGGATQELRNWSNNPNYLHQNRRNSEAEILANLVQNRGLLGYPAP